MRQLLNAEVKATNTKGARGFRSLIEFLGMALRWVFYNTTEQKPCRWTICCWSHHYQLPRALILCVASQVLSLTPRKLNAAG
jgi:hypothetical protein